LRLAQQKAGSRIEREVHPRKAAYGLEDGAQEARMADGLKVLA